MWTSNNRTNTKKTFERDPVEFAPSGCTEVQRMWPAGHVRTEKRHTTVAQGARIENG